MKKIFKQGMAFLLLMCLMGSLLPAALAAAPTITEDIPVTASVVNGGELTLTVTAAGEGLTYQWYKNDEPVKDQTSNTYKEAGMSAASDNARYYCYVQNSEGGVRSKECKVTVIQAPVLIQDISSLSLTVNPGDTITLSASASGSNLLIQWFYAAAGGEYRVIQGQSGTTLSLVASAEYNDTDIYCQFTNEAGNARSSRCHITVNGATPTPQGPPAITKDPIGEIVEEGGRAIFIARADDVLSYTWRFISPDGSQSYDYNKVGNQFPGLAISGGNTDTLTLSNISSALDGWKVACAFTGNGGTSVSKEAGIQVQKMTSTLSIINQPVGGTMELEENPNFTLSIQANASNGGSLSYQWYSAATNSAAAMQPISGATNSSYRPEQAEGTRYYRVSVTLTSNGISSEPFYSTIVPVTFTASTAHEHSYSSVWESNDISHWHQCTCGDHSDEAFHTYEWTTVKAASKTVDGEQKGVCSVCGHETVQPIPAGTQTDEEPPAAEKAPAKRSSGSVLMVILGVLAVAVVAGAAFLIRKVLREDNEEEYEDDEEYEDEYDEDDEYESEESEESETEDE